ncbi:MAG: ADP-forming succinate--CoA ligase subunit beta [Fimbriimonadaceae bacterium]
MKLHEYQSKDLFSKFGVPVTPGEVAEDAEGALRAAQALGGKVVVKAQVLMGGRGKAGGVKLFERSEDAAAFTGELIGKRLTSVQNPAGMVVERVLVAQQIEIAEEYYLSILLDRAEQKLVVMCSKEGGVEIEEVAERNPDAIARLFVDPAWGAEDFVIRALASRAQLPARVVRQFVPLVKALIKAYVESDAELIEVNPLAWTSDDKLIAADAKVSIDDNAQFRHAGFQETADESAEDPLEAEAARQGIAYVRLGGDIGIIGNGAGLVMCSIDEVSAAGGKPANFLDVGGGAKSERVEKCVRLVLSDTNVKGLLINIFGGITRGEEVAKGILEAFEHLDLSIPVVARIEGTGAEEALRLLAGSKIVGAATMQEAAQKAVSLSYSQPLS